MPLFTPEVTWLILIQIINIVVEFSLIYIVIRKYFRSDYANILIVVLLAVVTDFIFNVLTFISIFISETNIELFQQIKIIGFLSVIISLYFLLLSIEFFEHETLLTQQQMIGTIFTTVAGFFILLATPQAIWSEEMGFFYQEINSPLTLFYALCSIILGVFMIATLRRSKKDSWITQKTQINIIIVSISIITFLPLIIILIYSSFALTHSYLIDVILRGLIILGFIAYLYSFGDSRHYSHFNRRRADKILVTNLNGLPLFHFDFKENVHYINETLFSGAVVAITMLMSESIKSSSPIAEVLMKNKYRLMLETKQSFIALILTPQANSYLRDSLERFSNAFDKNFTSLITSGEVLDLNLFIKSGLGVLFDNFGISKDNIEEMIESLTMEEILS